MQDLAGTALRRVHLAVRSHRSVPVLRHARLATRPSCECLTSGGSSYILRPPVPPLTPSSSIEWRFFAHSGGQYFKTNGGFSCIFRRVAIFETSICRKRARDARFTATRSEMFDLPPHIATRIVAARKPLIPPPHVDRYPRPLHHHVRLLTETNICLLLCYDD